MGKISDATFSGYDFTVYPSDTTFNSVGAVYIFTKRVVDSNGKGTHTLLYIGQTESLQDRIQNHEKWSCANKNGVNCICIHRDDNESSRLDKETNLRGSSDTPCNNQ